MTKQLLGLCIIGGALLVSSVAKGQSEELQGGGSKGMLFPDLAVVKFFSTLMEHDISATERLFLDTSAVSFGVNGGKHKGISSIRAYIENWLASEKVDLFMNVDKIEVRTETAQVGGYIKGELLDLTTGLSRHVRWSVDSTLRRCGDTKDHWCLFELNILDKGS